MFPIPWNFPLRKKNGNLVNIGDAIDAGTEIPEHGEGDAGKVLSVDDSGELEWSDTVNSEIQTLTNKLADEVEARAKNGAHNLLPNKVSTTTGDVTGVTKNEDGTVTIEPRTDIPSGEFYFSVRGTKDLFLPNGTYIMSGGMDNNIYLGAGYTNINGEYEAYGKADATDLTFTVNGCNLRDDGAYLTTWLSVKGDISSELTIYPMIRLASDNDTTYQPYAMTNRELTEEIDRTLVDNASTLSFSVKAAEMYIAFTQGGGASNSYSYIWLVIANNNGSIRITPIKEGTQQAISITESGSDVTINCADNTVIMGYTKI